MTTIDLNSLTPEQILELSKEVTVRSRQIKSENRKKEKYQKFEPFYSEYRKSVLETRETTNRKESLLKKLRELGFGTQPVKKSSESKVKTVKPPKLPTVGSK